MAAGTTNKGPVNDYTFASIARRHTLEKKLPGNKPLGFMPFDSGSVTVAATNTETADDQLFIFTFPTEHRTFLVDFQAQVSDLDTHATPTLVLDWIAETPAAVETVLINDSTAGQAGGYDEMDRNLGLMLIEVTGMKLGFRVVTGAATAVSGTCRVKGIVWIGEIPSIV